MIPINIIATVNNSRFAINQNERYSYQARGANRTIIFKTIPLGQATLIEVFNHENIPGLKELSKSMRENWKFVLNSIINFERVNENICILFRDGVLNDIIIKLEIIDVSEEENFDNLCFDMDYFNILLERNIKNL